MLTNLSTILRQSGLLSLAQEESLLEQVNASGISMPEALVRSGYLTTDELLAQLSETFGLPSCKLSDYDFTALCQQLGLRELITRHHAIPVQKTSSTLILAVADPTNQQAENDFRFASGLQVDVVIADFADIDAAIRRLYGRSIGQEKPGLKEINQDELANLVDIGADEIDNIEDLSQDESPVSRYINQILLDAVRKGASDIHFEPYEKMYRVRLRCDGILIETQQPPSHLSRRLSARIKILSKLDIAERRLPQDGRIKLKLNQDTAIDMRVSTLPTLFGEKIVLRLLDSSAASLDIDKLGYSDQQKQLYLDALRRPQGMILMTGPTGSGKTVSLYTGLNILNKPEINISTAEDPVEINLSGINQVQVQPKIGFGFAEALRSFLRQDPDVVMVGEIRDLDTAEIAIKAAQTGHLVLSTLHTNSAAETVVRLSNMGVESFNLASSLSLIIAQRLARKLCSHCKQPQELTAALQHVGIHSTENIFQANPHGCNACTHGYSGRTGIYEVMHFNESLSEALIKGASVHELEKLAISNGMSTLQMSGLEKLKQGITSFSELQRVLYF
ncbi:ATPase PilB [Vibrio sp. B1FLJ16]|uniref:type IV-A pilus assembly ATPase PilB n=1 Tax=Vibrio sp. B1FLJ16 TaxID=2751178 RepID=UPI0015F64535|nr:type IV-A pilus assembly ATPase PilB [Vibrio sp. B1FLJ16]CAD7810824.1 ATPase PilB [Vibrio sp. B1FLJ16]CAE6913339.1 ATPase PilB [Vibrio sp. B1FLJ16]